MRNDLSFINVYKKPNLKSEVVTQLLYGDEFSIIKKTKSWLKIKNKLDNYKGFIKNRSFPLRQIYTHKIYKLSADLYVKPNLENKIKKKLSFGSKIKIVKEKNKFCKFDNLWIKKKDLKKINYKTKDTFNNINKFINTRYKWGGKHFTGVDCSGLIQLFINFNNRYCPRDAKDQVKYFKKKIELKNVKKNDLIFWKGHVAVVISKKNLIHAYGPFKKTVKMPIERTVKRIYKTAKLKVIGIRRIS